MKKRITFSIVLLVLLIGCISLISAEWNIRDVLNQWVAMGVFDYVLPFLLVFALVFGIVTKTTVLGENRIVHAIIALAIASLSLVGDFVPRFFHTILPNLGIGLSILLAGVILLGLFYQEVPWVKFVLVGVAILVFLVVGYSSLADVGFVGSLYWSQYGPALITLAIIVAIIMVIVVSSKKSSVSSK